MAELPCEGVEGVLACPRLKQGSKPSLKEDARWPRLDRLTGDLVDVVVARVLMHLHAEAFWHLQAALLVEKGQRVVWAVQPEAPSSLHPTPERGVDLNGWSPTMLV